MTCRVMVFPKNGRSCWLEWEYSETFNSHAGALERLRESRIERALEDDHTTNDIFICPLGEDLVDQIDQAELERVAQEITSHSWGAPVYVVVDKRIENRKRLISALAVLVSWVKAAIAGRVTDLVQINHHPSFGDRNMTWELQRAKVRAGRRHDVLRMLYSQPQNWYCLLPLGHDGDSALLGPWVLQDSKSEGSGDLIMALYDDNVEWLKNIVEERRLQCPWRRFLVAKMRPTVLGTIEEGCTRLGLPQPIDFGGILELRYFLERLNWGKSTHREGELNIRPAIPAGETATFRAIRFELPMILLTSSFGLDEAEHVEAAAEDVGRLLGSSPLELSYRVEPAINLNRLRSVLRELERQQAAERLRVWIHMGHGDAKRGLVSLEQGRLIPCTPDEWLSCFHPVEPSRDGLPLDLVIFLTCFSADAARCFARAGAGVAIGFEGEIETKWAWEVVSEVLRAALRGGMSRAAVLAGFDAGRVMVENALRSQSRPVAYYYPGAL